MKTFVVIGLGRFGSAVSTELCALGHEVLAIDRDPDVVQSMAEHVTHAAVGDAKDPDVLKELGVRNYDCAIVAISADVGDSALITLTLKDIGVAEVICRVKSHVHQKVLERVGADRTVFPEHEIGMKLAKALSSSDVLNFIELSEDYSIVEMLPPEKWQGKTIRDLNIGVKYGVIIIAIRDANGNMKIAPAAEYVFREDEVVIVLGQNADIDRIHQAG